MDAKPTTTRRQFLATTTAAAAAFTIVPRHVLGGPHFVFGWAKPVPVNFGNLRDPKRDMLWVAAAGPAVNFAMALAWAVLFRFAMPGGMFASSSIVEMARIGVSVNLVLMALNLLPIPPLDGGRIAVSLLPMPAAHVFAKLEPFGLFLIVGLLAFGVLDNVMGPLLRFGEWALQSLVPL